MTHKANLTAEQAELLNKVFDNYNAALLYMCEHCPDVDVRELVRSYHFDRLRDARQLVNGFGTITRPAVED